MSILGTDLENSFRVHEFVQYRAFDAMMIRSRILLTR